MYARWNENRPQNITSLPKDLSAERSTAIWVSESVSSTPVRMDESEARLSKDVISNATHEHKEGMNVPSDEIQGPTKKDYMIPLSKTEHEEVVRKLVLGGSSVSEAELVIATRKTAFNKANKEFKKKSMPGVANMKKSRTSRKLSNQPDVEYGS